MQPREREPETGVVHLRGKREPLPRLVRFIVFNLAIGGLIGVAIACALLATDVAHLWTLISSSPDPILPTVMLCGAFALTFASLYTGAAIMHGSFEE